MSPDSVENDRVLPDDVDEGESDSSIVTERSKDREREEESYVPVIVKRMDEVIRHPDDTLEQAIHEGLEQLERPILSLSLSSLSAGLLVGFSAMAVAVVTEFTLPYESPLLTRLATAIVYPLGFVVCVMSGAQLFTEHTATAVYPILDRKAHFGILLRLWFVVIVGNLVGCAIIALLFYLSIDVIDARDGFINIGLHLVHQETMPLLVSSVLAGCLMAEGAWLVLATHPDVSQLVSIYFVTFLIGLGGFHHSIAGSAEILTALFISDQFTWQQAGRFVLLALFGNLFGGSLFVGVLNYAHIRQTQSVEE